MEQLSCLSALTLPELEKLLAPLPRMRAAQIYKWIIRGVKNFDGMTDIPNSLREELKARFLLYSSAVTNCHNDTDTKKLVLTLKDGLQVEAVLLNDGKERYTACLSTQAGCPAGCVFCKTGSLGFARNLSCEEIVEQFIFLRNAALENADGQNTQNDGEHAIDNIVVMGMGEPLLNMENLRRAIAIFTDPAGRNISRRRITVSTCGICGGLFDISENGPYVRLALSLTTADEPLRQKLMPVTAANPLAKTKEALAAFQKNGGGRITLETVLLGGINTREKDALSIANFANGLDTVVNIIPWNPVASLAFEGNHLREPSREETERFARLLETNGLKITTRRHKGRNVNGACGQLGCLTT